jgi:hypothetical protein
VLRQLGIRRQADPLLDDRGVEAAPGGDHALVGLRELDHGEALALELLGGLAEAPRVVSQLGDREPAGEFTDVVDAAGAQACDVLKAKNVLGARRVGTGAYCVQVAAGINPATSGAAAGVDNRNTEPPEGNGTAMTDAADPICTAAEIFVVTERITVNAPVVGGNAQVGANEANDVGFWVLVP